jgi:hypothetical protein
MCPSISDVAANPTKIFDTPAQVLAAHISNEQKLAILKSWEDEAHQLQTATDENMSGGEPTRLGEIRSAIDALEAQSASTK